MNKTLPQINIGVFPLWLQANGFPAFRFITRIILLLAVGSAKHKMASSMIGVQTQSFLNFGNGSIRLAVIEEFCAGF